ncbi:helix-turn-helix domain-containing protein [Mesorhizobium sp. BR1-1-9]|nr:helix-turn-helix domain-containing protein [Mesorhizobium sp. BR1-1-9]
MAAPAEPSPFELIWGAEGIAAAINKSTRQVFHMLESGTLPAKKVGGRWVISKQALVSAFC